MTASQKTTVEGTDVPDVVAAHLAAHEARDAERELACYADRAVVVDDGHTYRGRAEIQGWLATAASEYTYTTELVGVRQDDDGRWTAVQHVEGNFPGGVIDLRYRYTLDDGLITELVIAP